jgi:hypothetical protein
VTEGSSRTRCRVCRKPIVWSGLCYTCATGLPRNGRPRENAAASVPRHQGAISDASDLPG